MKARAPGKLLLTGAYAVLEGAPAIVQAVDRYAIADDRGTERAPSAEVRAAVGERPAPAVDVRALHDGAHKLGLGSSAAALVATLALAAAKRGEDLSYPDTRKRLFRAARTAHAQAQGGGSGVDVAASVYGGVLRYRLRGSDDPELRPVSLPPRLVVQVFWSGVVARTSELRARVDALRDRSPTVHGERMEAVIRAAVLAADAVEAGSLARFVAAGRETARALAALGDAADAPIVPPTFAELAAIAVSDDAAFVPSGAGGGDVAVYLGASPCTPAFVRRAESLSMRLLPVAVDRDGARVVAEPFIEDASWPAHRDSQASTK